MLTPEQVRYAQSLLDKVGFVPTPAQESIINCQKRFILVAGGEQSGKSYLAAKYLLRRLPEVREPGLYWLVAADYERTRKEFEYLAEDLLKLGFADPAKISKRVDPGEIVLKDFTRIVTKSDNDPRTLAMEKPNGIVACEASQLQATSIQRLIGRTAPAKAWLFMSGTFESSLGLYPKLFTEWENGYGDSQSFSLPSWSNTYLYPGGREDPEILKQEREQSDYFFMERIAGRPVPPAGLVFSEFRGDIHVRDVEWDRGKQVYLAVDPGYGSAFAVLAVQIIDGQVRVIDEVYERNLTTEEIIETVYNPAKHPWAVAIQHGTADVAALQHQAQPAVVETWEQKSPDRLRLTTNRVKINDGTELLKRFLKPDPITKVPKLVISPKCRGLLSELGFCGSPFDGQTRTYHWKTDSEGNIVGREPEDMYNHSVKALWYLLYDVFGWDTVKRERGRHRMETIAIG